MFLSIREMSLVTRKPVFRVWDQVRLKPVCSATKTSQGREILDIASRGIILSKQQKQRRWWDCANVQADMRLCCLHMAKTDFPMTWLKLFAPTVWCHYENLSFDKGQKKAGFDFVFLSLLKDNIGYKLFFTHNMIVYYTPLIFSSWFRILIGLEHVTCRATFHVTLARNFTLLTSFISCCMQRCN